VDTPFRRPTNEYVRTDSCGMERAKETDHWAVQESYTPHEACGEVCVGRVAGCPNATLYHICIKIKYGEL
jgi:hypothetical protein